MICPSCVLSSATKIIPSWWVFLVFLAHHKRITESASGSRSMVPATKETSNSDYVDLNNA